MRRDLTAILLVLVAAAIFCGSARAADAPCLNGARCTQPSKQATYTRLDCPIPATLVCAGAGLAGDIIGTGLDIAGDAVMDGLTSWVAGGAAWLLTRAVKLMDRSTKPALGSTWFQDQYRTMLGLGIAVSMLFLLCAILQATVRHDARGLIRAAFFALPLSILLCFTAVTFVEGALGVTDWMTASVLQRFQTDTGEFFADVGEVLVPSSAVGGPLPGFLLFLGGLMVALATFVVWLELIMREAAIYITVAFLPLCFSAMVWDRTAHWCRRLVEILVAVILAKLGIAVAIAIAAGAMAHGRSGEGGLTALMAGCAVMVIAAFTPWLLLRMIPIAEAAGNVALQRGSARSAVSSAPGAQTASMVVRQTALSSVGSGGGLAASRAPRPAVPTAPPPLPMRQPEVAQSTKPVKGRSHDG